MAGVIGIATPGAASGGAAEVAVAAATTKTVLQLQAVTHRLKVLGWGIYFDSTNTAYEPVLVKLIRQTSAGTMSTGAAYSITDSSTPVAAATSFNATAEPTPTASYSVMDVVEVHPQQGYEVKYPMGQEIIVNPGASENRIGIVCTTATGVAVNCTAKIIFEE
jgi:hypothetical protein